MNDLYLKCEACAVIYEVKKKTQKPLLHLNAKQCEALLLVVKGPYELWWFSELGRTPQIVNRKCSYDTKLLEMVIMYKVRILYC